MCSNRVLYKDFGKFVEGLSQRIKAHSESVAKEQDRPFRYLESATISKEDLARQIIEEGQVKEGLVCVLSCVELRQSFSVRKDREAKQQGSVLKIETTINNPRQFKVRRATEQNGKVVVASYPMRKGVVDLRARPLGLRGWARRIAPV